MALENGSGSKIEAVTESVTMRLVARASMVVTPFLIAIFGWALVEAWEAQKEFNHLTDQRIRQVEDRVLTIEIKRSGGPRARDRAQLDTIPPGAMLPNDD